MDKVSIPFDIEKLLVKLPATYFEIDGVASGFVAGNIPIDTMKLDLRTDILKLNYKGIELSQSDIPLNIRYDDGLTVSSASNILFNIDGFEFDLNNAVLDIGAYSLSLKHANLLSIDGLLSSKINAFYNFKNGTGIIGLKDLNIQDKESLFYSKDKLIFSLKSLKGNTTIRSEELDSKIIIKDAGWDIKLNSLAKIANDSQFLKKFRLTQGKVALHKKSHEKFIKLNADIKYPYKLLVENNTPTQNYKIRVKISPKKAFVNINENINVEVDDNIALNIKNCGINIPEVLNLLRDINTSSNKEDNKRVLLDASNSYLYVGHDRKIISDRMSLQYQHGITTAQLEHKDGHAGFKLENKDIHLYGENFNDEFMENLFSLAKFKDGKLNFSMNGTIENYDGLFYITDTTIVDYKMLNNILAFINTVPALTTFSLPGYNKTGLKVKSAYMNFNAKNSVFTVSDFFLDSKEIDILGGGVADLNKDKIDVTLNLKTDLGSSVSKIPLVGYILLGDDNTISTTMKITGKLTDPDVKSLIAKDIVVAPINIITRALLLPYDLIKAIKNTNESK